MQKAIIESIKELLRVGLIAVIPVLADSISTGHVSVRAILITAAIAILRALDKMLHEWGKSEENKDFQLSKLLKGGLTRF